MRNIHLIFEIARFEFKRTFKIRQFCVTLLVIFFVSVIGYWGVGKLTRQGQKAKLVVIDKGISTLDVPPGSRIELAPQEGRDETVLRESLRRDEIAGLLTLKSVDEAELLVVKQPVWLNDLEQALSTARREVYLKMSDLSPQDLTKILAPFHIDMRYHETGWRPPGNVEVGGAIVLISLMLSGVFIGSAYLFVGITGEKQLRVTEQIISAIPPQTWIDGKILGLSAVAFISVTGFGVVAASSLLFAGFSASQIPLSLTTIDPLLILQFFTLAILGFFLWFTFFAAVAATIDDPNTSARNAFILLPLLTLSLAFAAVKNPDSLFVKILGLLPFFSPTVLPARIVMTKVAWWEVVVAVILLALSACALRRAAGKIFSAGMLMYGKEPSCQEIWRWLKEA